jgi:hypothetical protein
MGTRVIQCLPDVFVHFGGRHFMCSKIESLKYKLSKEGNIEELELKMDSGDGISSTEMDDIERFRVQFKHFLRLVTKHGGSTEGMPPR